MINYNGSMETKALICALSVFILSACGGGSDSELNSPPSAVEPPPVASTPPTPPPPEHSINGMGIKGPLVNANVSLYRFDANMVHSKGSLVTQAVSNEKALITGLTLNEELDELYVIEFTVGTSTIDMTTDMSPAFTTLRNIVTKKQIESGTFVVATPLSTLTLALLKENLALGQTINTATQNAEITIRNIFAGQSNGEFSTLSTIPTLDASASVASIDAIWLSRLSNEVAATLITTLFTRVSNDNFSLDDLVGQLAQDLIDGKLDASAPSALSYEFNDLTHFNKPISELSFAGSSDIPISDMRAILDSENSKTGLSSFDVKSAALAEFNFLIVLNADLDEDGIVNTLDTDADNDGYVNSDEAFPFDATEWRDFDQDNIGDNADVDDDNDGVADLEDAIPEDATEWRDFDQDNIGDNADSDDDNDGVADLEDAFPEDATEWRDFDKDNIGDNADSDDDNDGISDQDDVFPYDVSEWQDSDADSIGDNRDTDDDNDGVNDENDQFPLNRTEQYDFDNDGVGDNLDNDDDNDGITDDIDEFTIVGFKSEYRKEEEIHLLIRAKSGFDIPDTPTSGFHIQYYTYDIANESTRIERYIEQGFYNAQYNSGKAAYEVRFPAPPYEADFKTVVSFYCSIIDSPCDQRPYVQNEHTLRYEVICSQDETCERIIDENPGPVVVSGSTESYFPGSFIKDSLGRLLVSYLATSATNYYDSISVSYDNGNSWSLLRRSEQDSFSEKTLLHSSSDVTLRSIQSCELTKLCISQQSRSGFWSQIGTFDVSKTFGCRGSNCFEIPIQSDLLEFKNGEYALMFSYEINGSLNILITKTTDFTNWSVPVVVNDEANADFGARILELSDGSLVVAHISYAPRGIGIFKSTDSGNTWTKTQHIEKDSFASSEVSLIEDEGQVRLFYVNRGTLYFQKMDEQGIFQNPISLIPIESFEPLVIKQNDGTYGAVYSRSLNEKSNIFYENLGTLDD